MHSAPKMDQEIHWKHESSDWVGKILYAKKGFLAYLPLLVAGLILLIAALIESFVPMNDISRYECYATVFWHGTQVFGLLPADQCQFMYQFIQYHTFPIEYPPLTLAIFSLPLLVPHLSYAIKFAVEMALAAALIYWLLLRFGPRGSPAIFALYLLIGAGGTAFSRFDLIPAGLTLLSLIWAEKKHWALAYISLAFGTMIKVYPALLFPFVFIAEQLNNPAFYFPDAPVTIRTFPRNVWQSLRGLHHWTYKNLLVGLGVMVIITGLFGWWDFKNAVLSSLASFYFRSFQAESTGSVIEWVISLFGLPIYWIRDLNSLNLMGPLTVGISRGLSIVMITGYISILAMMWQKKMDAVQASIATLLILLSASKVFSPQYLIWLIPLLAYSGARHGKWWILWGGISLLTLIIYPGYYALTLNMTDLPGYPGFMLFIALRDGLFVLLTVAYLINGWGLRQREPLPSSE